MANQDQGGISEQDGRRWKLRTRWLEIKSEKMAADGKPERRLQQTENKNQDGRRWQIRTKMAANGK
jgi:hypothetical protein